MTLRFPLVLAAITAGALPAAAQRDAGTVVFVCEHGTAKSVVALAYFQKLATERGLPYRAISRGTAPDAALPAFMLAGLARDGFELPGFTPTRFGEADLKGAVRVISFDQPSVAEQIAGRIPVTAWDGLPSVTADYARASSAIKQRVTALVDSLASGRRPGKQE
jgi:arsenate reductase